MENEIFLLSKRSTIAGENILEEYFKYHNPIQMSFEESSKVLDYMSNFVENSRYCKMSYYQARAVRTATEKDCKFAGLYNTGEDEPYYQPIFQINGLRYIVKQIGPVLV